MTETDTRAGVIGGQLGTAAPRDTTFHGGDPDKAAPGHASASTRRPAARRGPGSTVGWAAGRGPGAVMRVRRF